MPTTKKLSIKQLKFVDAYALSGNASDAARQAGYSSGSAKVTASRLLTKTNVSEALSVRQAEYAAELQITKDDVIAGLLAAIGIARKQQNPSAMIQGCTALGKMLGFFSTEVGRVEVGVDASAMKARMAAASDGDLLAIARGGNLGGLRL